MVYGDLGDGVMIVLTTLKLYPGFFIHLELGWAKLSREVGWATKETRWWLVRLHTFWGGTPNFTSSIGKKWSGWWCNNHLEKYEFVSWDYETPNIWKNESQNLVGGFNHLEKYELVNGKDDIPYIIENKKMFETTSQWL